MSIEQSKLEDNTQSVEVDTHLDISAYPISMSSSLTLPQCAFDEAGVPSHLRPRWYDPTTIAQYALAQWNEYIATGADNHRKSFLAQAYWLVEHEVRLGDDVSGWLNSVPSPDCSSQSSWLSALTQGNGISVLVRAYQMTHQELFLEVARRAVRTFELDILDGGVSTPVGNEGVFFEEVAVYPAAHNLNGFILALFGLYDYVKLTGDIQIEKLIQRGLMTMHTLLEEFDAGFWTRADLLHRRLASPSCLALQCRLLETLSSYSGGRYCSTLASRWRSYQYQLNSRVRYLITERCSFSGSSLWRRVQTALFPRTRLAPLRVCIPLPAFPFTGGVLTFLEGVAQLTKERWQIEYLTQYVGPHPERFTIHRFGNTKLSPRQFPLVWLYILAGCWKLFALMRRGAGYHVILPQDGVFTAAFAVLTAKITGVRVVCIDHSILTWPTSHLYRAERIQALATKNWPWAMRRLVRLLLVGYWPSLSLLARFAARHVDHFLIPGVAGDEIEEVCKQLKIPVSRVTRFASMIDTTHHVILDGATKATLRQEHLIPDNAVVVAIVCRLSPEKGLDVALESLSQALSELPPDLRARIRVIIAGDGPLRTELEKGIRLRGLMQTCYLWGDIAAKDVLSLLAISDIFLYTSTRGACFPMAVLEAMASACAVIASTEPVANAVLLAEGRGMAVSPGDVLQTSHALVQLLNNRELCQHMGRAARSYIEMHHSPALFRRILMRSTYWSGLDELLTVGEKIDSIG